MTGGQNDARWRHRHQNPVAKVNLFFSLIQRKAKVSPVAWSLSCWQIKQSQMLSLWTNLFFEQKWNFYYKTCHMAFEENLRDTLYKFEILTVEYAVRSQMIICMRWWFDESGLKFSERETGKHPEAKKERSVPFWWLAEGSEEESWVGSQRDRSQWTAELNNGLCH